jgi:hypothetical protein
MLNIKPETPGLKLYRTSKRGRGLLQTFKFNTAGQVHYYDACLWRVSKLHNVKATWRPRPANAFRRQRAARTGGHARVIRKNVKRSSQYRNAVPAAVRIGLKIARHGGLP